MSLRIDVTRTGPNLNEDLAKLQKAFTGQEVNDLVGRAATNTVREHLFAYDRAHPNKMGGRRINFYAQAARATNYRTKADGVTVSIPTVGIRQRYYGGIIRPNASRTSGKPTRLLTIAANAESYGKRAGEFSNLHLIIFKNRGGGAVGALVENTPGKSKNLQPGRVMFWLIDKANQKPNPDILPTDMAVLNAITKAVSGAAGRLKA